MVEIALDAIREQSVSQDNFHIFISQISDYSDVLDASEEKRLAKLIKIGDENALETMCNHNLRLVISIAKKYVRFSGNMVIDDLIQEGYFGLRTAAKRFKPEANYKFSTYATYWIRQAILRSIRNKSSTIRIPIHLFEKVQKIIAAQTYLKMRLGREPSLAELSEHVGMKQDAINRAIIYDIHEDQLKDVATKHRRGSHNSYSHGGDYSLVSLDRYTLDPDLLLRARLEIQEICKEITRICQSFTNQRNLTIFCRRFGLYKNLEPKSLEVVANEFHITRERVRQIIASHFRHLKKIKIYSGDENDFLIRIKSLLDLCDCTGTDFHNLKY